jgi:hypothetical protein
MKRTLIIGTLAVIVVAGAVWGLDRLGVRVMIVDDGRHRGSAPFVDVDMNSTGDVMLAGHEEAEPGDPYAIQEPIAYQNEAAEEGADVPDPFLSDLFEQAKEAAPEPFVGAQELLPDFAVASATFADNAGESEPQLLEEVDEPAGLESLDALLPSLTDEVAANPGDELLSASDSFDEAPEHGPFDSEPSQSSSSPREPAVNDDLIVTDRLVTDDVFGGTPEWTDEISGFPEPIGAAISGDRYHNERVRILTLELWDKIEQLGSPRHPFVENARKALEFEVRRGIQSRHEQQRQEITRLRNRLNTIEQRLTDRVKREDHLVQASMNTLLRELERQRVFSAPPLQTQPGPAIGRAEVADPFAPSPSPSASVEGDEAEPAVPNAPFAEAHGTLEQVTVRIKCRHERNEGFPPDEYNFDGVLLANRGLIVSSLPERLTAEETTEALKLTIAFPATRTMTDARLVSVDEQTGLTVLEPDLFPDETPELELNFDEIATGDRIFVATVVDGQFDPDQVEVATAFGHARRLVGRPRTISRLATDIQSLPGSGGAPLLSEDGRLGGVMSASEPGQYIGAAKIERILTIANDAHVPGEASENPQADAKGQSVGSLKPSSESMEHGQKTLDNALQLFRSVSERKYDVEQAERELNRLQELSNRGDASPAEVEKAQSALNGARKVLNAARQTAEIARSNTIAEQYAQAALKVANAEYQVAEEANRKVTNTVPKAELRRLALRVEHWKLELELVHKAQELLDQTMDKFTEDAKAEELIGPDSSLQPASEPDGDPPAKLEEDETRS